MKIFPQKYVENVKQDASIGTNILRVSASDEDADNNGAIVYTLSAPYNPNDLEYFEIQPESGWIVLRKPLDVSHSSFHYSFPFARFLIFYKLMTKTSFKINSVQTRFLTQKKVLCSLESLLRKFSENLIAPTANN